SASAAAALSYIPTYATNVSTDIVIPPVPARWAGPATTAGTQPGGYPAGDPSRPGIADHLPGGCPPATSNQDPTANPPHPGSFVTGDPGFQRISSQEGTCT